MTFGIFILLHDIAFVESTFSFVVGWLPINSCHLRYNMFGFVDSGLRSWHASDSIVWHRLPHFIAFPHGASKWIPPFGHRLAKSTHTPTTTHTNNQTPQQPGRRSQPRNRIIEFSYQCAVEDAGRRLFAPHRKTQPGIEPRSHRWQQCILPLDQWCDGRKRERVAKELASYTAMLHSVANARSEHGIIHISVRQYMQPVKQLMQIVKQYMKPVEKIMHIG